MAKLQKMDICGIRSFGPFKEHVQSISFCSPLTLFLGKNGCGKTTIIEALKYICTGDVPEGTDSGQAFINDPKLTSRTSTTGQIKLKFIDAKGDEVTVSRIMEVTQKKDNKLTFSSKNVALKKVTPSGNEISISNRCADVNSYCCQALNVSPAILNNVIFCHQENSSWPLEEGKKLKEKFDKIFDAEKYNKCIEVLRKYIKDKESGIKVITIELEYKQRLKDDVEKEKVRLQDKENKLIMFQNQIVTKRAELNPIKQRIEKICGLENELCSLEKKLSAKKENLKGIIDQQLIIKSNITFIFEASDEELQSKIESFQTDRLKDENAIRDLDKRKGEVEAKMKQINLVIQEIKIKIDRLNEEKSQFEKKQANLVDLIKKGVSQMNLNVQLNKEQNNELIMKELNNKLKSMESDLNEFQKNHDLEESKLQKVIDEIREKHAFTKQNLESNSNYIREYDKKIIDIKNELESLNTANEMLDDLNKKIENIDRTLQKLNDEFQLSGDDKKIAQGRKEIRDLEQKLEDLDKEYRILMQNNAIEEKLEAEKQSIVQKRMAINELKNKHFHNLKELFGEKTPASDFKRNVEGVLQKNKQIEHQFNENIAKKQKLVTTLEIQCSNKSERIKMARKELCENENQINLVCHGKNFGEVLEIVRKKREKLQRDKGQYRSAKIMYEKFIQEFEKKDSPCCPVCQTNFQNKIEAIRQVVVKIRQKIEKIPQELSAVEEDLKKEEELYDKLQQLKPISDNIEILTNVKLPLIEEELNDLNKKLGENLAELGNLQEKIKIPKKIVEICGNIITDMTLIDQYHSDINSSQKNGELLKSQIVLVESNRSRQEAESEIDNLRAELSDVKKKVETCTLKVEKHKERCQKLMQDRNAALSKQIDLQNNIKSSTHLESQRDELSAKVTNLRVDIQKFRKDLIELDSQLNEAVQNKQIVVLNNKKVLNDKREEITTNKKILDDIERVQKDVAAYLKKGADNLLSEAQEELSKNNTKNNHLEHARNVIIDGISKKKSDLDKREIHFRSLKDNLALREKQKLETDLEVEIANLKKEIGDYNYRSVYEEKQQLLKSSGNMEKDINVIEGQVEQLESSINESKNDLSKPDRRDAYKNWRTKYYELIVSKHVLQDVMKYARALEKSIIQFHKSRMIEVNKTIRELWRSIYRGNDIDYVEIKTEDAQANAKKRNYNYKVVQVKKGVEIEMRGRCSAGQRVLACLIIRIALAETFSTNCGILALDEPTTNLDRENISSLCDSLSRIVRKRQQEKNFQLLVITHDEEFLDALTRDQDLPHYYRVKRDEEGFSKLEKIFL